MRTILSGRTVIVGVLFLPVYGWEDRRCILFIDFQPSFVWSCSWCSTSQINELAVSTELDRTERGPIPCCSHSDSWIISCRLQFCSVSLDTIGRYLCCVPGSVHHTMQLIARDCTSYSVFEKCLFLDYYLWSANRVVPSSRTLPTSL